MPLVKGDPAPFDGQLLTPELAIRLGQKADGCERRIEIEATHVARLATIDLDLCRQKALIDRDAAAERDAAWQRRLDEAGAWYRAPLFVAIVSVVVTAGLIVLARETVIEGRP